jgi:DNA repair exonuclease SbcCD ATPase subunit
MKRQIHVFSFFTLMLFAFTGYAQVYKTAEDTVKLNKEFTEVSNDIANLTARLEVAQNNMPGFKSKANTAESNAQEAAVTSSEQADKARGGGVKEARKAKRNSKKAYREAKDARSANENVGDQDNKIASLKGQLAKKQERLSQLTTMRTAIMSEFPNR